MLEGKSNSIKMNKHFFIIGAQRSGTTYLYNVLNEHPEICMNTPVKPEPKFFLNKSLDEIDYTIYINSFFSNCNKNSKIFGEKSTSYYEFENTAQNISTLFSNAKILLILRNPVDRAISNYFFSKDNGLEKRSISEVFLENKRIDVFPKEKISVNPFNYLGRGIYINFVLKFTKYFKKNNFKILIFEEFKQNPNQLKSLYNFLEVDESYIPQSFDLKINASSKDSKFIPETVIKYLRSFYKEPNKKLENYLERKISVWEFD